VKQLGAESINHSRSPIS